MLTVYSNKYYTCVKLLNKNKLHRFQKIYTNVYVSIGRRSKSFGYFFWKERGKIINYENGYFFRTDKRSVVSQITRLLFLFLYCYAQSMY